MDKSANSRPEIERSFSDKSSLARTANVRETCCIVNACVLSSVSSSSRCALAYERSNSVEGGREKSVLAAETLVDVIPEGIDVAQLLGTCIVIDERAGFEVLDPVEDVFDADVDTVEGVEFKPAIADDDDEEEEGEEKEEEDVV